MRRCPYSSSANWAQYIIEDDRSTVLGTCMYSKYIASHNTRATSANAMYSVEFVLGTTLCWLMHRLALH